LDAGPFHGFLELLLPVDDHDPSYLYQHHECGMVAIQVAEAEIQSLVAVQEYLREGFL